MKSYFTTAYLSVCFSLLLSLSLARPAAAQISRPVPPIIDWLNTFNFDAYVAPDSAFLTGEELPNAMFELVYGDSLPAVAQAALEYAASVWATHLASEVPVRVSVSWKDLEEPNILASAGPSTLFRDFPGAVDDRVWYPVALAEAIVGENLNEDDADIVIQVNSRARWYFGTDGRVPANRVDLVSVAMHELGHGLGFLSSADTVNMVEGELGFGGIPIIYDLFLTDGSTNSELATPANLIASSRQLLAAFSNNQLFFDGPAATAANGGRRPRLYAPAEFNNGSSVSHLDENAFPSGSINALMSPRLAWREAIHEPGPVALGIMRDMGWLVTSEPVDTRELIVGSLRVFPNPASDLLRIERPAGAGSSPLQVRIADQQGRLLQHLEAFDENQPLPIDHLPAGWYAVSITNGRQLWQAKILIH